MKRFVLFICAALFLTSCAGLKEEKAALVCPSIGLVKHADTATYFAITPTGESPQEEVNAESYAQIERYSQGCGYDEKEITVDLDLGLAAILGPASYGVPRPLIKQYTYFVAIVNDREEITSKQEFVANLEFPEEALETYQEEPLRLKIPVDSPDHGGHYKVLIGFQLTKDQLAYNRGKGN